ncbi:conserved hypothetical protein [Paecilomyces variotii No. 5]|uniref:Uncharacterized protein n=1 Tax=Byssochlamys spectabilis (strain No. 5 / NBRC 109023) TaxID=1356009 RepID=V5G033_BYSSN|nr:conserved hypothetical protein [Paecilomyces variotii No. 5]
MSEKEKGKEARKEAPADAPDKQSGQDASGNKSMASRIQDSASGLLRNAISAPGAYNLPADLAQSLANGSKAGASAPRGLSSSSTAAESFQSHGSSGLGSSAAETGAQSSVPASFRSGAAQEGGFRLDPLAQDDFQRGADDSFLYNPVDISDTKGKGKGREQADAADSELATFDTTWETHHHSQGATVPATPNAQPTTLPSDGSAVVSLLADPSFQPEFLPTEENPIDSTDLDSVPPLTASEVQIIESFRRHPSMASETQSQQHRITSQSLIPDIDAFLAQDSPATDTAALRESVLHNLPGAEDWMAVEERYHDEVWGYLRPALEAAQKEIEETKNEGAPPSEEGPAVRRLRMILQHMQT